jgi:plastocyanin
MISRTLVLAFVLGACGGGGDDDDNPPVDSPVVQSSIQAVDPCTGESATVTTDDATFSYMPAATTISQGQIVKFVTSQTHDVAPKTSADDPGLKVNFNQTKCLRFTEAGTFNFKCTPHGFTGTITVN